MANSYWNSPGDFVAGTLVKAAEANTKFNGIESGFDAVEADLDSTITITAGDAGVVDIPDVIAVRKNKVLSFDASGDLVLDETVGEWKGDHADAAGTDYAVRDVIKDAAGRVKLDSIYRCNTAHTSTGQLNADIANFDLVIDMTDVKTSETNAANSASAASGSATTSSGHSDTANEWANKVDGFVSGSDNSSKSWAIGGTGDGEPTGGNAKDWATQLVTEVDGSEFSAKEYAVGTSVTAGSAIQWATEVEDTPVTTGPDAFSALHHAAKAAASAAAIDLYDIAFSFAGVLNDELIASFVATRAFTVATALADSQGYAQVASAGGAAVFSLAKNGAAAFGTVTFADGVNTDALASGSGASFSIGDRLTITTAADMHGIAGVSIVLVGAVV